MRKLLPAFEDETPLYQSGIILGGVKYMFLRCEGRSLIGRKVCLWCSFYFGSSHRFHAYKRTASSLFNYLYCYLRSATDAILYYIQIVKACNQNLSIIFPLPQNNKINKIELYYHYYLIIAVVIAHGSFYRVAMLGVLLSRQHRQSSLVYMKVDYKVETATLLLRSLPTTLFLAAIECGVA